MGRTGKDPWSALGNVICYMITNKGGSQPALIDPNGVRDDHYT